jgi:Fe-S oxidoreductase
MHTTRGRARLLFEMLEGEIVQDGWDSPEVMEALDLCLACKGCTHDCPVNVDMPTYKAEFLYHHYKGKLRPRHAYAFGLIDQAARVASRMPEVVNLLGRTPPFKLAAGMSLRRKTPTFAPLTLQQWFRDRGGTCNSSGQKVVLYPDTFNNHFHTDVGVAAVEAIEAAGWQVVMPEGHVCCGRPLYDYGFLDLAERYLRRNLETLREWYREDVPIVGLEPSCVAVFKDELLKLFPHDDDAKRLCAHVHHLGEFFEEYGIDPPPLRRKAFVWGHCHHKATGGVDPDLELLKKMGVETETIKAGYCGLAGSWGFESAHYDVSMAAGEHGLLPKVRELEPDAETIYYVYVVDRDENLVGVLSLRDLIVAKPDVRISDVMIREPITVRVLDDQDHVAGVIARYNLLAVPVVNDDGHLEGIVTVDDALDAVAPEASRLWHPRRRPTRSAP